MIKRSECGSVESISLLYVRARMQEHICCSSDGLAMVGLQRIMYKALDSTSLLHCAVVWCFVWFLCTWVKTTLAKSASLCKILMCTGRP